MACRRLDLPGAGPSLTVRPPGAHLGWWLVAAGLVLAGVAVALVVRSASDPAQPWSAQGVDPAAYAAELVVETNAARADEGLAALTVSACATDEALARAAALDGGAELEHASLTPVIEACSPASSAAENLVRAAATPHDVVDAWLGSTGHRANLLDATRAAGRHRLPARRRPDALLAGVPRRVGRAHRSNRNAPSSSARSRLATVVRWCSSRYSRIVPEIAPHSSAVHR